MVDLQPHAQRRAQRPAGQADLDPAGRVAPVVPDRPAHQAVASAPSAVLPGELPAVHGGHAGGERDVHDPLERRPARTGQVPALILGLAAGGTA